MTIYSTAISELDAFALGDAFRRRSLSPVEAAQDALDRAEASQASVNAFALIDRERTLGWARESEARWTKAEPLQPLRRRRRDGDGRHGGDSWPSMKPSKVVPTTPMAFDAPVTARCKDAGLVILGAHHHAGIRLDRPVHLAARQAIPAIPWNSERTAGGSTSGAAAAALGIGRFHLGSDGLGSIRIPAAFCGVAGIKATYGRVPAYPISVMGELAHLGPIARDVREVAALLTILSGPDARDPMAWNTPAPDYRIGLDDGVRRLRIAYSPRLGYREEARPAGRAGRGRGGGDLRQPWRRRHRRGGRPAHRGPGPASPGTSGTPAPRWPLSALRSPRNSASRWIPASSAAPETGARLLGGRSSSTPCSTGARRRSSPWRSSSSATTCC